MSPSEGAAVRLREEFQRAVDPPTVPALSADNPDEVLQLLPAYDQNAENPAFGILVIGGTAYALQSGINLARERHGEIGFQRGALRNVRVLETTPDFIRLEAHVEAQAAALMRKHGFRSARLFLNAAPCDRAGLGCKHRLPALLEEGAVLDVYWPTAKGTKARQFTGLSDEEVGQ